jgi:hypothetical protein
MYPVKQSTALTVPFFVHDANGDAVTGLTDGSFTKRISKNGAAFGAMTVIISEMENGWYSIPLSTAHSDTLGLLTIVFTNAGAKQVNIQFRVHARLPDDLAWPTTTGRSIDVTTGGAVGIDWANVENKGSVVDLSATDINLVDTTTTNTDMRGTDNAALASVCTEARLSELDAATGGKMANQVDIIQTDTTTDIPATIATAQADLDTITGTDGVTLATAQALYAPSKAGDAMALTAGAVDAIIDETLTSHVTADSLGVAIKDILTDTGTTLPAQITTAQNDLDLLTGTDGARCCRCNY